MAGFAEYEVTVTESNGRTGKIMVSAGSAKEAKVKAREVLVRQGIEYRKLSAKGYW